MPGQFDYLDVFELVRSIAKSTADDDTILGETFVRNSGNFSTTSFSFPDILNTPISPLYDADSTSPTYGLMYIMCGFSTYNCIVVDADRPEGISDGMPIDDYYGEV